MVEEYKIAVISTAHLTASTADVMEESPAAFGFVVAPFEEGFFVSCANVSSGSTDGHESLWLCRKWASERDYQYLMLDRDAEQVEGLPVYDW